VVQEEATQRLPVTRDADINILRPTLSEQNQEIPVPEAHYTLTKKEIPAWKEGAHHSFAFNPLMLEIPHLETLLFQFRIFLFAAASRPALGPTQPPIELQRGILSHWQSNRGVKLTTHLNLAPR
jgi:hypothetical protein